MDPWASVACQSSQLGEFQDSDRLCFKIKVASAQEITSEIIFWLQMCCLHIGTQMGTPMQTHKHTHMGVYPEKFMSLLLWLSAVFKTFEHVLYDHELSMFPNVFATLTSWTECALECAYLLLKCFPIWIYAGSLSLKKCCFGNGYLVLLICCR